MKYAERTVGLNHSLIWPWPFRVVAVFEISLSNEYGAVKDDAETYMTA